MGSSLQTAAFSAKAPSKADRRNSLRYEAARAWGSLDPDYWTHGLTINQGNGWSVTEDSVRKLLSYIAFKLLREMFGNNFRNKARIRFLGFRHGSMESGNQHFHVLMAIEGEHDWSDERIAIQISQIDDARERHRWEKPIYVDWDWNKKSGNFHSYCAREVWLNDDKGTYRGKPYLDHEKYDGIFVV
jgi:hypothetical protein